MERSIQKLITALKKDVILVDCFKKTLISKGFLYFKNDNQISSLEECLHAERFKNSPGRKMTNRKTAFSILKEDKVKLEITEDNNLIYDPAKIELETIKSVDSFLKYISGELKNIADENTRLAGLRGIVDDISECDINEGGFADFKKLLDDVIKNEHSVDGKIAAIKTWLIVNKKLFREEDFFNYTIRRLIKLETEVFCKSDFEQFYRGQPIFGMDIIPSIYRKNELYRNNELVENESRMYFNMSARFPNEFPRCDFTIDALAIMQHYGLPTRLLDITGNPLISLYFACIGNPNEAGEVIVFLGQYYKKAYFYRKEGADLSVDRYPIRIKHSESDTVSVISNIVKMPFFKVNEKNIKRQEDKMADVYKLPDLLHFIKNEKSYFEDRIHLDDLQDVVIVKSKNNSARINAQDGAFLLYGIGEDKYNPAKVRTVVNNNDGKMIKLYIPAESKEGIIEELSRIGIHEGTIFPEMEHYANYLKKCIEKNVL